MSISLVFEHVFDIRIDFEERHIFGPTPEGCGQGYVPAAGGTITGPRLSGRVVPKSGADFATVRPDGVVVMNAHYMLEASDGALIYVNNRGYLVPAPRSPDVDPRFAQPRYFRLTPTFKVATGPHDWLARTVIVGTGERHNDPDHSLFRYYAVL